MIRHCHLADEAFAADLDASSPARGRPGVERRPVHPRRRATTKKSAPRRALRALVAGRSGSRVGVHPHQAGEFAGRLDDARPHVRTRRGCRGRRGHRRDRPRLPLRFLAARRAAGGLSTPGRAGARAALPVVIHTREATDDTFAHPARGRRRRVRGVFHCFTGDVAMARRALDLGFYVSLAGIVTFPQAEELRDVAELVPADRLLIETDAPVPGAGAAPRQAERAGVCRARGRDASRRCAASPAADLADARWRGTSPHSCW